MLLRVDQEERQAALVVPDHHIADRAVDLDVDLDAVGSRVVWGGDQDTFRGGTALVGREFLGLAVGGERHRQAMARQLLRHGGHRFFDAWDLSERGGGGWISSAVPRRWNREVEEEDLQAQIRDLEARLRNIRKE